MTNPYTGEVSVEVGNMKCTLVYDWRAISHLQAKYGREKLGNLFVNATPEEVADILVIGLKKLQPNLDVAFVLEKSPPVFPIIRAIDTALSIAYFGPEMAAKLSGEEVDTTEKKTL